jgi:hypothetical protein
MGGPARRVSATLVAGLLVLAAPAPQADAAITFVAQNSVASTTSSLAITKPAGTTTADVMIATVAGAGTTTISAPAGWTLLDDTTASGNGMRVLTYFKIATASEGASYTFSSSSARNATGGIVTLRGANGVMPIDAVAEATGASGSAVAPSVTTTAAGDWVLTASSVARNTTFTAPAGSTERYDRAGTSTSTSASTFTQAVAGATAAKTAAPANATSPWVAHTIAVRDAAAAGLSLSVGSATASFSTSLDSGDSSNQWSVPVTVNDTRTSASAGWQVQVTSTTFTAVARTLATTATDLTAVSAVVCDNNAPCDLPVNSVTYPVDVPAGAVAPTGIKAYNAAAASGEGRIDFTASFTTLVPQNAFAGTYSASVTISVVSGP